MMSEGKAFDDLVRCSSDASAYAARQDEISTGVCQPDLDLKRISDALECIPLPDRLGISKEVFLPEQIAEFEKNALAKLKVYEDKLKKIALADMGQDMAREDLNKVLNVLSAREHSEDSDSDEDEEAIDPNEIVAWLDKVLAK